MTEEKIEATEKDSAKRKMPKTVKRKTAKRKPAKMMAKRAKDKAALQTLKKAKAKAKSRQKAASQGISKGGVTKTPKRRSTPRQIEKQVREVLIALLDESESDSVRVAAAKALMDRFDKTEAAKTKRKGKEEEEGYDEDIQHAEENHAAALAEACALLADIAAAKSGSVADAAAVD